MNGARLTVAALLLAGYAFTLFAFYPGYLTTDATFVYDYMREWKLGDWQSPLMSMIWAVIDPIAPGPGSMFVLIVSAYWLAFTLIALTLVRRSIALAVVLPLLALMPPAFLMLSMIWRDILFSAAWLLAAAILYAAAERPTSVRLPAQVLSLTLIGCGILLRPNAVIAAPLLIAYALWPARFHWKRVALAFVPALIAGIALVEVVYYGVLHVERQHPEHSLMVFDLGGITHFSGENAFPVTWSDEQNALLATRCYDPSRWDLYWTIPPCDFVMQRLEERDKIFGTPQLTHAWLHAIMEQPLAYLRHRLTFFWQFIAGSNVTLEIENTGYAGNATLMEKPLFKTLLSLYDALKPTPLFRTGTWLIFAAAICVLGWRRRMTASGAFAIGVCASAVAYVMTFLLVGVAADFRYGYWCVLASVAGAATALAERRA